MKGREEMEGAQAMALDELDEHLRTIGPRGEGAEKGAGGEEGVMRVHRM